MTTVDDELEVLEYFQSDVSNDHYLSVKKDKLEELKEDDDARESAETRYNNRRDESQHKKKIRTTIMAGFLRNGLVERQTNWEFKSLYPLRTLDVNSADVLIGNQTDGSIILIVILPLRQRPSTGINEAIEMIEGIRSNGSTLSRDIDLDFHNDRIQTAIAIDRSRALDTATAIEDYESSVTDSEEFYVWRIVGTEGEKIDIFTDFPTTDSENRCHNGDLGQILNEGVEIMDSPHILPSFFYDTHHSLLLEHTVTKLASNRRESDIPNTHFSRAELRNYFDNTLHGPDSTNKAMQLVKRMITLWKHFDLIAKISPSNDQINDESTSYRFKSRKRNPKSIYDDVSEDYDEKSIEFLLEVESMEVAIQEYEEENGIQSDLATFGD
ncbi:hypothetical protein [Haloarcula sp. JP-L23]|uniref:hypothetical protein n=1 Tax=Haloarcula sp. JP-L23 TaxID=2716717 RepID=UPI00140EE2D6|nr:hypothetical protein G9465_24370 [Haloarcula sp. JP-L23]